MLGLGSRGRRSNRRPTSPCVARCVTTTASPTATSDGHLEWAPGRKIDPAGPSRWAAGAASWNMAGFRTDVTGQPKPEPPTPIPDPFEEDDVPFLIRNNETGGIALVYGAGKVTGLDGDSVDDFVAKFGPWIDMPPVTYNDFASKGG